MKIAEQLNYLSDLARSRLMKSFSWVVGANFTVTLLGFASSILVFRTQSADVVSTIYPLVSLFLFLDQIADLGLTTSYVRHAAGDLAEGQVRFNGTTRAAFQLHTLFITVASILAALFSARISQLLFQNTDYTRWITMAACCAWFYSFGNFMQSILQVEGRFGVIAFARVLPNMVKVGLLFLLLGGMGEKFPLLVAAFLFTPLLALPILLPRMRFEYFSIRPAPASEFKRTLDFARWIFLSAIAVTCISQIDIFMLSGMVENEEVARFLGGQRLASVLPVLISSLAMALLPKISSYKKKDELSFFLKKVVLVSPLIFLFVISFSLVAPWVIPFALGAKYAGSVLIFQAYCFVFAFDAVITLYSMALYNLNMVHWFAALNFAQLALNYLLNLYLIPRFGALGVCISAGLIRVIALPLFVYLYRKEKVI